MHVTSQKFVFDSDLTSFPPMFKMEKGRVFKTYEEFEAALKSFSVALTVYL